MEIEVLFMNRATIILAVAVVLASAGAWAIFGGGGEAKIVSGEGIYGDELYACQDKVFEDLQHPLELVFIESRDWHAADDDELTVGGMFQMPNVDGGTDTMDYSCLMRGGKILFVDIH